MLLAAFLATPAVAQSTRTALVIGNARYETAVGPLRNPVNDAKAVAKALRSLGFTVLEEHNVTRSELLEAVSAFRRKSAGAEVALFYYAGHGITVSGSNYLIPVKSGYDPGSAEGTALRMLAETRLFNAEQAVAEMSAAGAHCNLVILDACRVTPIARDPQARDAATAAGGLREMKPPAGSLIAFSTDAGHTANDGQGTNGLYTEELLKHMLTPGLTIEQVFKRTRAGVLERSSGSQIPAEYSRLIGEDIYLAGQASETAPTAAPSSMPAAPPVAVPDLAAITRLAAAAKTQECLTALHALAATRGAGDYAIAPMETLLENVKNTLKDQTEPGPAVESAQQTCEGVLEALEDCIPAAHEKKNALAAKAHNRRGDCLLLFGRALDALDAYEAALAITPDDAYVRYNRARAHLALGNPTAAKTDLNAVLDSKTSQPGARKLATKELEKLK